MDFLSLSAVHGIMALEFFWEEGNLRFLRCDMNSEIRSKRWCDSSLLFIQGGLLDSAEQGS